MSTLAIPALRLPSLRMLFFIDAATCVLMGLGLLVASGPLSTLLGLPVPLLEYAGFALLPIAAFIVWVAVRPRLFHAAPWAVIAGNVAWVGASIALLAVAWVSPNLLGQIFIAGQAAAVVALAVLEFIALRR